MNCNDSQWPLQGGRSGGRNLGPQWSWSTEWSHCRRPPSSILRVWGERGHLWPAWQGRNEEQIMRTDEQIKEMKNRLEKGLSLIITACKMRGPMSNITGLPDVICNTSVAVAIFVWPCDLILNIFITEYRAWYMYKCVRGWVDALRGCGDENGWEVK